MNERQSEVFEAMRLLGGDDDVKAKCEPAVVDGWRAATDGHMMVALRTGEADRNVDGRVGSGFKLWRDTPTGKSAPLAALVAWAGDRFATMVECGTCLGTGRKRCDHCQTEGVVCDDCDGDGKHVRSPNDSAGIIRGMFVDRVRVALALRLASDGESIDVAVREEVQGKMLVLRGAEWLAFIMAMRERDDYDPRPVVFKVPA